MRFLTGCLFLTFFAGLNTSLYAQLNFSSIRGKVLTENHLPAEGATIVLLKYRDSSIMNSAMVGRDGIFQFANIQADNYLLLISKVGFDKVYSGPYRLTPGQRLNATDIILDQRTKNLDEVTILSTRPEIEVKPGKITLNIPNSLISEGNSAFEILRQAPGVRIDNDNNISVIGRQSALIMIDGKPINLSGGDLVDVLRGLQSSIIDNIELITSGSAKYDAAGGGIINIVLKKGKNTGFNGTVTGGLGFGKYPKDNTGIVFNYGTNKFNIFGSYAYSFNHSFHTFTNNRILSYENATSNFDADYNSTQKNNSNTFSIGTDYFISADQTIGFLVNGAIRDDQFIKDNSLKISYRSVLDSIITANSNVGRHVTDVNYNLNYNWKIDKSGKILSANFNYADFDRSSSEYITNDFYNASGSIYQNPQLLQNLSPSSIHIWLSKADFTDPISKTSKLEAGIKYSNVISDNNLIFGPRVNGVYQRDSTFSNHFIYTENVNSAYVNYETKFDKFGLRTGLRAEQTNTTGNSVTLGHIVKSNYLNFFPQVSITYKKDDDDDFALSYNRGVKRPAYQDINPFLYYVDVFDYRAGNPNLKPEYSNSVELSYNYKKTLLTTLYANIISDAYNFDYYIQNDTSKINVKTQKNLGKICNYGIKFITPVTITNWWNADFNLDLSYQRYIAYPTNGPLNKGTQDVIFASTQHFIISKTVLAEISGKYESPTFYGITEFKANYSLNAGIGKQLFNKRGSIRLNAIDIFNTLRDRAQINYQNLNMAIVDKKESQVVRLVFTYRFGKLAVKSLSRHTGNEEEQKRAGADN